MLLGYIRLYRRMPRRYARHCSLRLAPHLHLTRMPCFLHSAGCPASYDTHHQKSHLCKGILNRSSCRPAIYINNWFCSAGGGGGVGGGCWEGGERVTPGRNKLIFSKSNLAPIALRIGLPGSSALQNDGFDVPVILQCRTHRETNRKGLWGPNKIIVFASSLVMVCIGPLSKCLTLELASG